MRPTIVPLAIALLGASQAQAQEKLNSIAPEPTAKGETRPSGDAASAEAAAQRVPLWAPATAPQPFSGATAFPEDGGILEMVVSCGYAVAAAGHIVDQATGTNCIEASTVPTLDMLYPITEDLFVAAGTGFVGVGTTTPAYRFEVETTGYGIVQHDPVSGVEIGTYTSPSGGQLGTKSNHPVHFFTSDSTAQVTLATDGKVGIGTTAPSRKLHVEGDTALKGQVEMGDLGAFGNHMVSSRVDASNAVQDLAMFVSNEGMSGGESGLVAQTSDPTGLGILCGGDLLVTGVKNFAQPHPNDPSKEIRFVSLEGNESGTYFRGKTRLVGGRARIEVPEDFRLVTDPRNLTVQLTAVGPAQVWLESYDLNEVLLGGTGDVEVHYVVNGERRGFCSYQTVRANQAFRPLTRGVPYATQLPREVRDILIQNGILNADYTPNEATAAQLGWKLAEPRSQEPAASAVERQ